MRDFRLLVRGDVLAKSAKPERRKHSNRSHVRNRQSPKEGNTQIGAMFPTKAHPRKYMYKYIDDSGPPSLYIYSGVHDLFRLSSLASPPCPRLIKSCQQTHGSPNFRPTLTCPKNAEANPKPQEVDGQKGRCPSPCGRLLGSWGQHG